MEDAMLIHRITRAPEKRIHYVNVGGIAPNEIDGFMEKQVSQMKTQFTAPQPQVFQEDIDSFANPNKQTAPSALAPEAHVD